MVLGEAVPEGLAAMPPGPELARVLADLDISRVSNDDIVDVLQAQSRQLSHEQARTLDAMSQVICRRPFAGPLEIRREDHPDRYGSDEVRAALCWTRRNAESESHFAYTLTHVLPLVQQALSEGRIDRGKAWVFAQHLGDLPPDQIAAICAALLPPAARLTAGQIAERIKRMILELDPAYYERRYRKAVRERMVVAYLSADGTAVLSATGLPADEAAAAWERLDSLARAARREGHPGTLHQIRADLVLGLLDGSLHGLNRDEILHALLERFAGHAEPAVQEGHTGTLVPTGPDTPGPDTPGPDTPRPDTPGPNPSGPDEPAPAAPDKDAPSPDTPVPDPPVPDEPAPVAPDSDASSSDAPVQDEPAPGGAESDVAAVGTTERGESEPVVPVPGRAGVGTEVRVPLSTLLELDDRAGELPGWGPIPATAARRLVARQRRAQWRWVVVDEDGHLVAEGITRHRPTTSARGGPPGGIVELQVPASQLATLAAAPEQYGPWARLITDIAARHAAQREHPVLADLDAHPDDRFPRAALRRHVQVRDRVCVHPGCRCSAARADQDHTLDHIRGGTTTQDDLAPLCRHHHLLKTEGGWQLEQPEPGRFVWRSPLGRVYPVEPEPILPPPPDPVAREADPWFDEPAGDGDHRPDLTVRGRAPPPAPDPARSPTVGAGRNDPPPF